MKDLYLRYKDMFLYLFFGICTTAVNILIYYICAHWLNFSTIVSTAVAWVLAVVFAFVTNKLFVFESRSWNRKVLAKEVPSFFLCRAATGGLDIAIMYVGVDRMRLFDVGVKVISNVIVIILNYMASKWMIFKKRK